MPGIVDALAEVGCTRCRPPATRTTSPPTPAPAPTYEEVDDPRVWAEVIRQWSTLHPEFTYLPRKFKIAVTASAKDRTAARTHDIGLSLRRERDGTLGFEVMVGGGLGRTPYIGKTVREHLPVARLLSIWRRSCGSTIATASATIRTRRGSRSWWPSWASRNSPARSRPNGR